MKQFSRSWLIHPADRAIPQLQEGKAAPAGADDGNGHRGKGKLSRPHSSDSRHFHGELVLLGGDPGE